MSGYVDLVRNEPTFESDKWHWAFNIDCSTRQLVTTAKSWWGLGAASRLYDTKKLEWYAAFTSEVPLSNIWWVDGRMQRIKSHNFCNPLSTKPRGRFSLWREILSLARHKLTFFLDSLRISKFLENLPGLPDGLDSLRILRYPQG